jgi:hypothetical protein
LSDRSFVGILLVALGVMFLLDNTDVLGTEKRVVGTYWPVLLIAWGLWDLLSSGFQARLWPLVLLIVGVVFLLANLQVWSVGVGQLWPVILVAVGLSFLLRWRGSPTPRQAPLTGGGTGRASPARTSYIFGGGEERVTDQAYAGGEVTAICGGIKLDLREAGLRQGKATLDATIICGGLELLVPPEWRVNIQTTTLLGGTENKRQQPADGVAQGELTITGTVLMGGIAVKDGVEVKD